MLVRGLLHLDVPNTAVFETLVFLVICRSVTNGGGGGREDDLTSRKFRRKNLLVATTHHKPISS